VIEHEVLNGDDPSPTALFRQGKGPAVAGPTIVAVPCVESFPTVGCRSARQQLGAVEPRGARLDGLAPPKASSEAVEGEGEELVRIKGGDDKLIAPNDGRGPAPARDLSLPGNIPRFTPIHR